MSLNRRLHQCENSFWVSWSFRWSACPAFAGKYNKVISVGDKAPDFSGIPAVENGEDTSLTCPTSRRPSSSWSSWPITARSSQAYEDRLIDFTKDYKDKGVKVVGIGVIDRDQRQAPGIKDYMKEHKSNYIYGYDESQKIGKAYGATNTPQFFVLDKERKIRYTGAMDDSQHEDKVTKTYLRDAVDALLKGESVRGRGDPPDGLRREVQAAK